MDRALLVSYAESKNIIIDEEDISNLDSSFEYDYDDVLEPYNRDLDDENTQDAKAEAIKTKLLDTMVKENNDFEYDDEELNLFYKSNLDLFKIGQAVDVRHVFVSTEEIDNDDDFIKAKKKINEARYLVIQGSDFGEIAKKYSDCPSRDYGGDLGVVSRGQISEEFDDVAFEIEENKISNVFMSEYGLHFIQVKEKFNEYQLPFTKIRNQLIEKLKGERLVYMMDDLLEELRDNAKIEIYTF